MSQQNSDQSIRNILFHAVIFGVLMLTALLLKGAGHSIIGIALGIIAVIYGLIFLGLPQ